MKPLFVIALALGLAAGCGTRHQGEAVQDSTATATPATPAGFFDLDSLQQEIDNAVQFQRQELRTDPDKINGYLARLDPQDPVSIPLAVHFIEGYPEAAGAPVYDTLYRQFVEFYYKAAMPFTDMFSPERYGRILDRQYDKPEDPQLKNFLSYLEIYAIKPVSIEGNFEADADPEFFYNVFSKKASPALLDFLVIEKKEMAEGFEMDAGLMIEYPQVYERIEAWGKFMNDHPGHVQTEQALMNYQIYLRTLLFGMDNSPVFEDGVLAADIKKLYETIQQQGQDAQSRKIITDYYALLAKDGFKRRDENDQFLDQYDLARAFGVKPAGEAQ